MSKITVEQFARLWGQVCQLPRKQLVTLKGLIEERLGPPTPTISRAPGRPRKTAEPPAEGV